MSVRNNTGYKPPILGAKGNPLTGQQSIPLTVIFMLRSLSIRYLK